MKKSPPVQSEHPPESDLGNLPEVLKKGRGLLNSWYHLYSQAIHIVCLYECICHTLHAITCITPSQPTRRDIKTSALGVKLRDVFVKNGVMRLSASGGSLSSPVSHYLFPSLPFSCLWIILTYPGLVCQDHIFTVGSAMPHETAIHGLTGRQWEPYEKSFFILSSFENTDWYCLSPNLRTNSSHLQRNR